ncbi:hypothetical protein [Actinoplanes sp. NPDC026670]|uniref:hypothetical protein n=1 Tax=Actinoplanes sp. NPDC026670 TaxID=3154700 RepID=UPI0033DB9AA6
MLWSETAQTVMAGDLVTVFAYGTPAGGVIAIPVSPTGLADRAAGTIGVTTSLAFSHKLRHILRDPRVAMAYHTREHGFGASAGDRFVLAQGVAGVGLTPSPARLAALAPQVARFLGDTPAGPFWNWLLREYHEQRVVIDIAVERVSETPGPAAALPAQAPPVRGAAPRTDPAKLFRQVTKLPHRVLGYRGEDGFPVIVPVRVTGHSAAGLVLEGPLPDGARRAAFTAHSFGPQAIGLSNRICTGWLDVTGGVAVYAPHTVGGFTSPPLKRVQLAVNGAMAKHGIRKARRDGTLEELARLTAA